MASINLLGIAGSLRAGAFSAAVLDTLRGRMAGDVSLGIFPLHDVPLYNQDDDGAAPPPAVAALRQAIAAADGLVIVTPEYNYGVPGVLKNALDWASRPYGASALIGKPVVTMSVSPAFTGGVRALAQLHETLIGTQSRLLIRQQVVIGEAHLKIRDGQLTDAAALGFAEAAVGDLVAHLRLPLAA